VIGRKNWLFCDTVAGAPAALVPKPKVHLTRFHGVFAPNSSYRARVTPARRGRGAQHPARTDREAAPTPAERRAAMTWAQRLKRVFGIDIQTCAACGGAVRIIACIGAATMPAGRVAAVGVKSAPTIYNHPGTSAERVLTEHTG
jgi:hypothetical protein